ncbi:MAG: hypothetical protein WCJ40_11595 [Planctomycetota bacterium]
MSTQPENPQFLQPDHPPEWRDDDFQIASDTTTEGPGFFRRAKVYFLAIFGIGQKMGFGGQADSPDLDAGDVEIQPFAIGQGESWFRGKKRELAESPEFDSFDMGPLSSPSAAQTDDLNDLDVAQNSVFNSFDSDEEPETPGRKSISLEQHGDDFQIASKQDPYHFDEPVVSEPLISPHLGPETDPEDVEVASSKRMTSAPAFAEPSEIEPSLAQPSDPEAYEAGSVNTRRYFGDQIQEQIGDLVDRLDISNQALEQGALQVDPENAQDIVEVGQADGEFRKPLLGLILVVVRQVIRWAIGIPWRSISQTGGILEQPRSRLEPILVGLPALVMAFMAYKSVIYLNTSDLLRERNYYRRLSADLLTTSDWSGAELAIRRACMAANTPENLWQYSQVMILAPDSETRLRGRRLIMKLAAPNGDNYPEAHIFLARELISKTDLKVEQVPEFIELVQSHLRLAIASDPNRLDAVEMLLDLLMTMGDDSEVQRLLVPRLERWPVGHYYLARLAFNKGDRVNQQISAAFAANYFESIPRLLEQSLKDRERYLLCLALAGQWKKAEPIVDDWYKRLDDEKSIQFWKNKFLSIRTIEKLDFPVSDSRPLIDECLKELEKDPKNKDLWNVMTQFADRQPAYGDSIYKSACKIIAANPSALDSESYMIWGNIARKRRANSDAREFQLQSVILNPGNIIAANNLANLFYKEEPKDYQRALKLIESVLKVEPNNPIYLETRGQIFALLGQDERAIDDLTNALTSFPNIPEIHETLSRLLRRKGSIDLALRHENRLTELRRDNPNPLFPGQIAPKPR